MQDILEEAHQAVYKLYPRYRGVRLSPEVLVALINGHLSAKADAQHSAEVRAETNHSGCYVCKQGGHEVPVILMTNRRRTIVIA
jgi:hypothetical protein